MSSKHIKFYDVEASANAAAAYTNASSELEQEMQEVLERFKDSEDFKLWKSKLTDKLGKSKKKNRSKS